MTTIGATGHTNATSTSILPDGRILVSGYHGNSPNLNVMLARYTSNGALDDTFGGGSGFVVVDGGTSETAYSTVVQPDGKIVAVGSAGVPTQAGNWQNDFSIVRLLGDPVAPISATAALSDGSTSTGRSASAGRLEILVPLTDHDLAQLATEIILSPKKRRGALKP